MRNGYKMLLIKMISVTKDIRSFYNVNFSGDFPVHILFISSIMSSKTKLLNISCDYGVNGS